MKRDEQGRFKSGNPGRPKGARNKTTVAVETLLAGEAVACARALVKAAKQGDVKAGLGILRAVAPPARDRAVHVNLPDLRAAEDAPSAIAAIVAAIGAGEITPSEGEQLASLVDNWRSAHQTAELEARIAELEAAVEASR